ncbi:MAG: HAMP domain-containing protein [Clostridia bacterium]|nr:HAMP domain-containing protein [Clostridia bacterium]
MFKSLYFKIVLILLIFIVAVMCAVAAILMNGVTTYYVNTFADQMEECFGDETILRHELTAAAENEGFAADMKAILTSYGSILGIDQYRNYYVLNMDAEMLAGSDAELGASLAVTPNLLSAISGENSNRIISGTEYADWAVRIDGAGNHCIIYVKDTLEEMRQLNQVVFSIILQAMVVGILIAILLSFFLAKAITSPIQNLTYGTQLVASGRFDHAIEVNSSDELGILTENFNFMKERLKGTLDEVYSEREKLETILACMRDAVMTFSTDGKLLLRNNSAAELFGDTLKQGTFTLEQCFEKLDIPLQKEGNSIRLTSAEAAVERTRDGFVFRDRIFGDRVYDVSFGIIRYAERGKMVPGCILISHDVTGRYELDESRREFVANVSHELRTPLTSIKGAAETILGDTEMDKETREYFLDSFILAECDRMTRIVSDLLTLSRLDNNRTQWNIEIFDMQTLLRRLADVMQKESDEHNHILTLQADDVPLITGDKQRLEQVFVNILSNAIKYTPDGGKIDISITEGKNRLITTITDNGIGIPEKDIVHLFERFYRVEKSRTSDAGGTGLGLAIAKEIVEAHGGRISVQSKMGMGTSVVVELPFECRLKSSQKAEK